MGGPGPPSSSRSVILGQHVPGVASPGSSPPLNSVRQFMYIATWNVLSLQSSSSKLHELAAAVDKFRLGVLLLTETHWPGVETLSLWRALDSFPLTSGHFSSTPAGWMASNGHSKSC